MAESTLTDEEAPENGAPRQNHPAPPVRSIEPGAAVGRYTIRAHVGSGGMGDVFAARDPQLDRDVALKVLRPELAGGSPESRARFQREAQALARLNHPNVVSVYDVGVVDDRVFVTMELIDGPTLSQWLTEQPRTWREVVAVFLEAGRGLGAAHAAGLVHRDFKASNVMLGDRVRVVDFGLARPTDEASDSASPSPTTTLLDNTITRTGQAVGTPAYMAPEQRRGEPATPLSDQYSFGVAMHEALFGARPQESNAGGSSRGVPAHLRALVERALRERPQDRFPSMRALLAELARDPARTRRRWMLGISGALVTIALAVAITWSASDAGPSCDITEDRLFGFWEPARREVLHRAFLASKKPYAEATWNVTRGQLDRYIGEWVEMQRENCRATRVVGQQSETLMDLRTACLDRHRRALDALLSVWEDGLDARALDAAADAVGRLTPNASCADTRALTELAPLPTDPAQLAKLAAVGAHADRAWAFVLAGRHAAAREVAGRARTLASTVDWAPARANVMLAEATALVALGDPAAEPTLLKALSEANPARDDRLVASLMVALVGYYALTDVSLERALAVADVADGALTRAGDDAILRIKLLAYRADALAGLAKYAEAAPLYDAAYKRAVATLGPKHSDVIVIVTKQAMLAKARGDLDGARALLERSLAAAEELFGVDYPRIGAIVNTLGDIAQTIGDYDSAVGYFERTLRIVEASDGPMSMQVGTVLANIGAMEIQRDHLARAETLLQRSLDLREKLLGPSHPHVAMSLSNLGLIRKRQGRFSEALALLERSLAIKVAAYGPEHPSLAYSHEGIGSVYARAGNDRAALLAMQRALQVRERALGREHPLTRWAMIAVADPLVRLKRCGEAMALIDVATKEPAKIGDDGMNAATAMRAECDLAAGRARQALERIEPVMEAIDRKAKALSDERGTIRWLFARALQAVGRTREAVFAARAAERELDASQPELKLVRSFLSTHR